jgi:hypothetical protein
LEEVGSTPDGLDISAEMIEIARRKCPKSTFYTGNVMENDSVCRGPYSLITAFRLLLNLDPELRVPILKALRDRIAPQGTLLINLHGNQNSSRHAAISWKKHRKISGEGVMLNEMTISEAQGCLSESGFEICGRRGFGVLPPSLYKFLPRTLMESIDAWLSRIPSLQPYCIDVLFICRPRSFGKDGAAAERS